MTATATRKLIRAYYDRFNAQDVAGLVALLGANVVHDISQGFDVGALQIELLVNVQYAGRRQQQMCFDAERAQVP